MTGDDLQTRLAPLTTFLGANPLTDAIARLENTLAGCRTEDIGSLLEEQGVSNHLLRAAFYAREEFGRINDVTTPRPSLLRCLTCSCLGKS